VSNLKRLEINLYADQVYNTVYNQNGIELCHRCWRYDGRKWCPIGNRVEAEKIVESGTEWRSMADKLGWHSRTDKQIAEYEAKYAKA